MSHHHQDPSKPTVCHHRSTHTFANLISQCQHHPEDSYPKHPFDTIARGCPHSSTQRYATHSITTATNYNPTGPGPQHDSAGTTNNALTSLMEPTASTPVQVPKGMLLTLSQQLPIKTNRTWSPMQLHQYK